MRMGIVGLRSAQVVLLPLRTVAAAVASGVRVCGVCQVELLCRVLMHLIAGAPLAWQAPPLLLAATSQAPSWPEHESSGRFVFPVSIRVVMV